MRREEINIRDPFILPFEGKYYMYGTRVGNPAVEGGAWGEQKGFDVYISDDLVNWSEPKCVFTGGNGFWGTRDFWAPEVHIWRGAFYMFASFTAEGRHRGTHILRSESPEGPFVPMTEDPATPKDWECLDGTFYVDRAGKPHIVFCHEWVQIHDGTVCEAELSEDLSRRVTEPRMLWKGSDYKGAKNAGVEGANFVTDGPFLYRTEKGELLSIWSSFSREGYEELIARSDNGEVDGNWSVDEQPLAGGNGGHGMIFRDFVGKLHFVMHQPNTSTKERPVILSLAETETGLALSE